MHANQFVVEHEDVNMSGCLCPCHSVSLENLGAEQVYGNNLRGREVLLAVL